MDSPNPNDLYLEVYELETAELTPTHLTDLRTHPPDVFEDKSHIQWSKLSWKELGKPYQISNISKTREAWEKSHGMEMPIPLQWKHFNRNYYDLFNSNSEEKQKQLKKRVGKKVKKLKLKDADASLQQIIKLKIWNHLHQKEDVFWDPRGKRKLFEGLDVKKPKILVLGAADGYDAMVLLSMYPGGHATLVDYDDFCRTHRFGEFPEDYPFLGKDPKTGYWNVYNREDFNIDYVVTGIEELGYGQKYDIVLSSGLIEHYPDKYKPMAFHLHRQFLKPDGYAIMTSSRNQIWLRTFYQLMGETLNFSYRELMQAEQLGLYAYENGFQVLRCGHIKAHNCVIAKER